MFLLLTGCAGFIGSHLLERLLADGHHVVGVDNFDPFYDPALKRANLALSLTHPNFHLVEGDLADAGSYLAIKGLFGGGRWQEARLRSKSYGATGQAGDPPSPEALRRGEVAFDAVIHLAAKAGVRPSIADPVGYQRANVEATQNLLEFARQENIRQFVFASSSSVYGINPDVPWSEDQAVLKPISPYASSKVSCELLGHVYSHLFGIRFLALRFFTVYGPRQRPDLAINKFTRKIEAGEPIPVFGDGSTRRDYTYVGDVVEGIIAALHYEQSAFERINLGNNRTVSLAELIAALENTLGKKAIIDRQPNQAGDVPQTWANISKAQRLLGYQPQTSLEDGVGQFVEWMRSA